MKKLPKTIFVKIERDDEQDYLVAETDAALLSEKDEKIKAGIHELKQEVVLLNATNVI